MLTPRYIFKNDFDTFSDLFSSYPHEERHFKAKQYMWQPDDPLDTIHFIKKGFIKTSLEHEDGYSKIISFHGVHTIFPGFHQENFKLERSLSSTTILPTETLAFTRPVFQKIIEEHQSVGFALINMYARYVNLLLYETGHQEYNTAFVKLCNLLFLLLSGESETIHLTQEEMATALGMSRVTLARYLSRLRHEGIIETGRKFLFIKNLDALKAFCSDETIL